MKSTLKPRVYLIGGLPRSGKTQIAQKLLEEYGIPSISTDTIRFVIEKRFTNEIAKIEEGKRLEVLWPYLKSLVLTCREFLHTTGFAIEGDLIKPDKIKELSEYEDICSVFVGYADVDLEAKIKLVRDYQHPHDWTDDMPNDELSTMLARQIEKSKLLRDQCNELGFKYVEMSGDFDAAMQEAVDYLVAE